MCGLTSNFESSGPSSNNSCYNYKSNACILLKNLQIDFLGPPRYESAAVFNETVEVAENMDNAAAEQFFMFLTLAGFAAIGFAYFASKVNNKKKPAVVVETGTSGNPDSSWIPEQHLKKKVAGSPKTSPNARRRKAD